MRGYVSSHGSSIAFKDEENTMKKNYFAEGSCHGHTFDDVPVQPHTLVSLKNQQYITWNVGSIITFNSNISMKQYWKWFITKSIGIVPELFASQRLFVCYIWFLPRALRDMGTTDNLCKFQRHGH